MKRLSYFAPAIILATSLVPKLALAQALFQPRASNTVKPPVMTFIPKLSTAFTDTSGNFDIFLLLAYAVNILSWVAGLIALGYAIYGGYTYILSAGDESRASKGRQMLIGSVVGIIIIALSRAIVVFVVNLFR